MWFDCYESRLRAWAGLRDNPSSDEDFLIAVNDFWTMAPMVNRDIDWHDRNGWPGPWDLLSFSGYSELAKALGIAYTIICSDRQHLIDGSKMVLVAQPHIEANLVLVLDSKYVLNWEPRNMLNICLDDFVARHSLPLSQLQKTIS